MQDSRSTHQPLVGAPLGDDWRHLMLKACATLIVLLFSVPAFSQSTGTISGRVTDESAAALPGVTVTATNSATGIARDTVTNAEGLFSLPALQPGTYNVQISLSGFAPPSRPGVVVLTGANVSLDIPMKIAAVAETITVNAE